MKTRVLAQLVAATLLATAGIAARAAGPDWSLIISGPQMALPAAPIQVAPVRVVPVQPMPAPSRYDNDGRNDGRWERERADYDRRFQDRENYYLERERAFQARERAFLEREKQRLLVVENNQRASQAVNDRQDQQLDRIVEGVNMNRISKDEFSGLMAQQKQIRNQERNYLSDGFLSQNEYQQLNAALDQADQAIRLDLRGRPQPRERQFYPQAR